MGREKMNISNKLKESIGKVLLGKDDVIEKALICLFADGHVLLEDIPGTGKTTLAKTLAKSVSCDFSRVQFTPDLLPSDITGVNFYNQKSSEFQFIKGAVFCNILLGDEINRATPRTQSSLLECMEEKQVSIDNVTYKLDPPFMVIATQNPIETQGTFPLPEAQLDRFMMRLAVGYPDESFERAMLDNNGSKNTMKEVLAEVTREEIIEFQQKVRDVKASENVRKYIVNIAQKSRTSDKIRLGISPRGSLALLNAAKAYAAMNDRDYVLPDDVKKVAVDVLAHRILIKSYNSLSATEQSKQVVEELVNSVKVLKE